MSLDSNSSQSNSSPAESILEGRIFAAVTSHEIQETPEGEKVTMFKVQVKLGSKAWTVDRRYREFDHLYNQIKKQDPYFNSKFPSKRILNNFSPDNINKRKKGLDEFIKTAVASPSVLKMPILSHFLKITPEHLSYLESEPNFSKQITNSLPEPFQTQPIQNEPRPPAFNRQVSNQANGESAAETDFNLGLSNNPVAKPNDFEFLKVVGKGSFGKVYMAMHKFEKKAYAVKILKKEAIIKRNEVKHIMAERNVLIRNLSHPFLVGLHYSFQSADKLYFVLDYVNGGELFYHLLQNRVFPEPRVKFYSAEIAHAIGYMHSKDIIYRDLKPENILIDSQGHIKLTDFGLCKEGIQANTKTNTFCGTPEYLAPEILQKRPYTRAIDWWCLGCVVYEMLLGLPPFYCKDTNEMYSRILHAPLRFVSHHNVTISNAIKSMLTGLLQKEASERLGANEADFNELCDHEFFADISWSDLLEKRIPVPWLPNISSSTDVQNIDPEFTAEPIPYSLGKSLLANRDREVEFRGFTYAPESNLK